MTRNFFFSILSALGLSFLAGSAVASTPGFTTANVNLRAGPGTGYPVVVTVPNGAPITTYGCLANYTWCDVSWRGERGWMSASYIYITYNGSRRVLTPALAPIIGINVVVFNRNYWNRYYVGRPWYNNWNRYYRRPRAVQPIQPPVVRPGRPPAAVQPVRPGRPIRRPRPLR